MRITNIELLGSRLYWIVILRESKKKSYAQIGEECGISARHAGAIYRRAKSILERRKSIISDPLYGLSFRTANAIMNSDIAGSYSSHKELRDKIMMAVKTGKLRPGKSAPRNFGKKSYAEVCKWLGLPAPIKPICGLECPECGYVGPMKRYKEIWK